MLGAVSRGDHGDCAGHGREEEPRNSAAANVDGIERAEEPVEAEDEVPTDQGVLARLFQAIVSGASPSALPQITAVPSVTPTLELPQMTALAQMPG
jgi:hypothetical protein